MFKKKNLIVLAILVLLAEMIIVPSLGALVRKKIISDQQFIDMCKEGDSEILNLLIKTGANVNAKDNDGITALMYAAMKGKTETVNTLINAGADVNANRNDGDTALMWAAVNGNTEIVNTLVKAGADLNAKGNNGWTACMLVASGGHAETVKALIKAGADDLTDNEGRTALILAAESKYSNADTVNALIDAGSYVKHKDNHGNTALDYARNNPALKGTNVLKRLEELSK